MTTQTPSGTDRRPQSGSPVRLRVHRRPTGQRAAVVLLHGGRADGFAKPPLLNLAGLRMLPFARALRRGPRGRGLLIASVRYRHRGWNGHRADPVRDVREALDELAELAPGLPVVLVGHSMGGRAALAAADRPQVRGVVALAPWCPPGEPVAKLCGRSVAFLHDETDRITSAVDTWAFARRAATAGADVRTVTMDRGGHAMLPGARHWHQLTTALVDAILDDSGSPPAAG